MSIAEQIAEQFDNDGLNFVDAEGLDLYEACKQHPGLAQSFGCQKGDDATRFVFRDGSSIVILGSGWDLGFTEDEADEDEAKRFAWPETFGE